MARKMRGAALVALGAGIALAVAGCSSSDNGGGDDSTADASNPVEMTFWNNATTGPGAEFFKETGEDPDKTWPYKLDRNRGYEENRLIMGVKLANLRIHEAASSDRKKKGMGTTFAGLFVLDSGSYVAHVGDSRVYRFRAGTLEQLTDDHSLLNEYVKMGRLTAAEIEADHLHAPGRELWRGLADRRRHQRPVARQHPPPLSATPREAPALAPVGRGAAVPHPARAVGGC